MLLFLSLSGLLSGCWSSHEVNTLGLAVCMGIDKGEEGYIISEQLISPKATGSMKATIEAPVTVYSAEGANIQEAITSLTTVSSRIIYSSHLRMVIFSEEIAKEGITEIVDYLMRYHEYRSDFYFAIAKGASALEVLSILTPIEAIPGMEMFDKLKMTYEEWAPTKAIRIVELANDLIADGVNPVINAIEIVGDSEKTDSTEVLQKSGDFDKLQYTEIGVFDGDKLVGWLGESDAKGYNYISGTVLHTSGCAEDNGVEITYDVFKARSKIKPSVENDEPKISVEIKVRYNVVGVKGDLDVSTIDNLDTVNDMVKRKITEVCEQSVQKVQNELKTDIFGFGESIHIADPTYWKTVKDNWNEVFVTLPVTINVTTEMISVGDISKPLGQKS